MIVCVCHRISDRDIAHAVRAGCESFDELQDHLRVGTACGACGDCALQTFQAQHPQPAGSASVTWRARGALRPTSPAVAAQPAGLP